MAVIGAIIGWLTNIVAIKLLFRPLQPVKILGVTIWGLIPKRREAIAKSVAETIESELLNIEQVLDNVIAKVDKQKVLTMLEQRIGTAIVDKLPSLAKSFSGTILKYLHEMMNSEGDKLLTEITESLVHRAVDSISVGEIVEQKLLTFDLERIEQIILKLAKQELVQIERLGGILGFIVGLIQGLIVVFLL